ncbi:MAG: mechanosensitive ion channel [Chromatiaceae bacterium]|nr:mechanosensitive ion channel [Chromatiaceae bacterium]
MNTLQRPVLPPSLLVSLLCCILMTLSTAVQSATDAQVTSVPEQGVTLEQIDAGRKAAESDATLDEVRKQKVLGMFDQATQWLQQASETKSQLAQLEALIRQAPKRIEKIRNNTAYTLRKVAEVESLLASSNLDAIKLAISSEQLALQQARENQRKHENELARLLVGSKGLSEEIAARRKLLDQIDADLLVPTGDEPYPLILGRNLMLQSRRMLRQAELDLLKLRFGNHDLLTQLTQAERDLAALEVADRQQHLDKLTAAAQRLQESRARQASEQAEELKLKARTLPESLQVIAQENASYRQELEELISREQGYIAELEAARKDLDGIKSDYERTRQRVEVAGASDAIGKMLIRRRQELPSQQSYRRNSAQRSTEIDRAIARQIDIEELLRQRGDVHSVVVTALDTLPEAERPGFEAEVTELAKVRRDALNELQKVYGRYIGQITSLDLAKRQLVEVSGAYISYIDDQLAWIPGANIFRLLNSLEKSPEQPWLLAVDNWRLLAADSAALLQTRLTWIVLLPVLSLFLFMLRDRATSIAHLGLLSRNIRKIRTDSFRFTLLALVRTLIIVLPWPLLLIAVGGLLSTSSTAAPFSVAVANGIIHTGAILLSIRLLIQISREDGLGDRHFGWPKPVRESLVREFSWILPLVLPALFLMVVTAGNELPPREQLIGRVAMFALMGASSLVIYRLLRRNSPLIDGLAGGNGGGPLYQLYFLWFPLLMLLPLSFIAISAWGYHNTALHLQQRTEMTFWFFVLLFLFRELILRSLYITERRLRFEKALARREELRAQRTQQQEGGKEDLLPATPEIPDINYEELTEQNKRLIRAGYLFGAVIGVWTIWGDLLPALSFLNNTELPFHASRIVDGIAKEVPVTLGDVTLGIIIVAVTVLAAKNIPGVLEIVLLQRLPMDAGARYAITSLTQYVIAGIGVITAFSTLGLQWSNIQWLVAALSVGLGFGLQEIVANFISGIILLFERPIRVGDVVTIENTTGKVSRIRIRATTIVNWDKQELLIPNKAFITGRVINWTLSDQVNRIVIMVGVAYGTDVDRAMSLMLEVARANPEVLEDPEPVVSFEAFGDNTLTLQLRTYLANLEKRLATITALHRAINARFNAEGITIAFPQRDVHLDTSKPLDIRIHRVNSADSAE